MAGTIIRLEGAARTRDRPRNVMETGKPCCPPDAPAWRGLAKAAVPQPRGATNSAASRGYLLMQTSFGLRINAENAHECPRQLAPVGGHAVSAWRCATAKRLAITCSIFCDDTGFDNYVRSCAAPSRRERPMLDFPHAAERSRGNWHTRHPPLTVDAVNRVDADEGTPLAAVGPCGRQALA